MCALARGRVCVCVCSPCVTLVLLPLEVASILLEASVYLPKGFWIYRFLWTLTWVAGTVKFRGVYLMSSLPHRDYYTVVYTVQYVANSVLFLLALFHWPPAAIVQEIEMVEDGRRLESAETEEVSELLLLAEVHVSVQYQGRLGLRGRAAAKGGAPCAVRALCVHCAKSRLFSTTGSHGSQGLEFCTLQPLLVHQGLFVSV